MATEIERKFLVIGDGWRSLGQPVHYAQGYLAADAERTVRVRIAGEKAYLTIKGPSDGISRKEYEYPIPVADAIEMLMLCPIPVIEKYRTRIGWRGKVWEVDEFKGDNEGLIMAEIELQTPDEKIEIPTWIGQEVSGDPRYFNSWLSKHPYKKW